MEECFGRQRGIYGGGGVENLGSWYRNLRERDHPEGLGVEGTIILKTTFNK